MQTRAGHKIVFNRKIGMIVTRLLPSPSCSRLSYTNLVRAVQPIVSTDPQEDRTKNTEGHDRGGGPQTSCCRTGVLRLRTLAIVGTPFEGQPRPGLRWGARCGC